MYQMIDTGQVPVLVSCYFTDLLGIEYYFKNQGDNSDQVSLKESAYVTPGRAIQPPVETPLGPLGLGICYDLRFAEHSQGRIQN